MTAKYWYLADKHVRTDEHGNRYVRLVNKDGGYCKRYLRPEITMAQLIEELNQVEEEHDHEI